MSTARADSNQPAQTSIGANQDSPAELPLTCTATRRKLYVTSEDGGKVEVSLKKLLDRRDVLRRQKVSIDFELRQIDKALEIIDPMGYSDRMPWKDNAAAKSMEELYLRAKPLEDLSLGESCLRILGDFRFEMNKGQVEYLASIGGYPFKTQDPVNSIDVTLRRLASDGRCEVRKGGAEGNLYSIKTEDSTDELRDKNSRATKT